MSTKNMNKTKSAKDLAFDKERAKYSHRVKELERALEFETKRADELEEKLSSVEVELNSAQDWIKRLLEYTDMSEEDMRKRIDSETTDIEMKEHLCSLLGVVSNLPFGNMPF